MGNVMSLILSATFLATIIRMTTPIMYASLAGIVVSRAGMMNLAVESTMLTGALMGVLISTWTQNAYIGLFGSVLAGILMSWVISYTALVPKADMFMNGVAYNLMMSGGTVFILYLVSGSKGMSSGLNSKVLPRIDIPVIENIPFVGEVLSGHYLLTYLMVVFAVLMHIFLFKTKLGLKLRMVGENASAAESVGINSIRIKMMAMCISGAMAAIGGCFMSMGYVSWFQANMVAGRGFIGMASAALGGEKPSGAFLAAVLFGMADATAMTLSMLSIPSEVVSMIPYVITIAGLIISSIVIKSGANPIKREKNKQNFILQTKG